MIHWIFVLIAFEAGMVAGLIIASFCGAGRRG